LPVTLFICIIYGINSRWKVLQTERNYNRKIAVYEADAKKEASAEVERAKGVAEANKIIGESLKENEAYLRWLWINGLTEGGNSVIYVPTEAGLPILEAGKR
jgi:regulator of protease activity HflC (stomatin/prohibitin superfamily)